MVLGHLVLYLGNAMYTRMWESSLVKEERKATGPASLVIRFEFVGKEHVFYSKPIPQKCSKLAVSHHFCSVLVVKMMNYLPSSQSTHREAIPRHCRVVTQSVCTALTEYLE